MFILKQIYTQLFKFTCNLPKVLEVNLECYNFILQKAEVDSNFIVKEEVKKLKCKN